MNSNKDYKYYFGIFNILLAVVLLSSAISSGLVIFRLIRNSNGNGKQSQQSDNSTEHQSQADDHKRQLQYVENENKQLKAKIEDYKKQLQSVENENKELGSEIENYKDQLQSVCEDNEKQLQDIKDYVRKRYPSSSPDLEENASVLVMLEKLIQELEAKSRVIEDSIRAEKQPASESRNLSVAETSSASANTSVNPSASSIDEAQTTPDQPKDEAQTTPDQSEYEVQAKPSRQTDEVQSGAAPTENTEGDPSTTLDSEYNSLDPSKTELYCVVDGERKPIKLLYSQSIKYTKKEDGTISAFYDEEMQPLHFYVSRSLINEDVVATETDDLRVRTSPDYEDNAKNIFLKLPKGTRIEAVKDEESRDNGANNWLEIKIPSESIVFKLFP